MRILDLAKEPDLDLYCKKLITERVKDFFVDFPELQSEAVNIVYDMCEDHDQEVPPALALLFGLLLNIMTFQVRIAGYNAITSVSKANKAWLMRNADVLVQLLQSGACGIHT